MRATTCARAGKKTPKRDARTELKVASKRTPSGTPRSARSGSGGGGEEGAGGGYLPNNRNRPLKRPQYLPNIEFLRTNTFFIPSFSARDEIPHQLRLAPDEVLCLRCGHSHCHSYPACTCAVPILIWSFISHSDGEEAPQVLTPLAFAIAVPESGPEGGVPEGVPATVPEAAVATKADAKPDSVVVTAKTSDMSAEVGPGGGAGKGANKSASVSVPAGVGSAVGAGTGTGGSTRVAASAPVSPDAPLSQRDAASSTAPQRVTEIRAKSVNVSDALLQ